MKITRFKLNRQMATTILTLAWPTMFEQLMHTAVQYVDTAMVGALGTYATAAVGATTTVNWLISSSISALSIGFLSFIAQRLGAGDIKGAKRASGQAVLAVFICGILFTVLTLSLSSVIPVWMRVDPAIRELSSKYFFILYLPMLPRTATIIFGTVLRSAGDSKTPMKIGVFVNLLNVVLNFLLIYPNRMVSLLGREWFIPGAGMGVLGAAVASAAAFAFGGICITIVLWKHAMISPKGERFAPDLEILKPCMRVALPNMLQRFATSFGYVAFAAMINSLGEIATAAHTIANTVESAFYIPGYGMQTAAATLAGNAYGAEDRKRMKDLVSMFIPLEVGLMILSGSALFASAPMLMGLFSDNTKVIRLGVTVLRMVAFSEPFYGFSIIMEGMLQGVGNTKIPFAYNVFGMWGIRIVGTFVCTQVFGFGLVSAWACMIAHNLLIFVLFLFTHLQNKWNPIFQES